MQSGDYIFEKGDDGRYQVCRILRLEPDTDTAHITSFADVDEAPSPESLASLMVTVMHAPISASSFAGWTVFAGGPVTRQDLAGFHEYLRLTDFNRYAEETGQDVKQIVKEANRLYQEAYAITSNNDNWREGIEKYHQAFELFPFFFEAKDNEAFCYMSLGEFETAIGCFEESIACNGHTFLTDFSIGECFYKMKAPDKAYPWFQRAQEHRHIEPKTREVLDTYLRATQFAAARRQDTTDAPVKPQPEPPPARPPGILGALLRLFRKS